MTGEGASSLKALVAKKPPHPSNFAEIRELPSPTRGEGTATTAALSDVLTRTLAMPERMTAVTTAWCGQSIERVEDAALLTGRGRFIDDLGVRPGTLHAAILRSPHAHAEIAGIDSEAARHAAGVAAVLTGDDIKALTTSLVV